MSEAAIESGKYLDAIYNLITSNIPNSKVAQPIRQHFEDAREDERAMRIFKNDLDEFNRSVETYKSETKSETKKISKKKSRKAKAARPKPPSHSPPSKYSDIIHKLMAWKVPNSIVSHAIKGIQMDFSKSGNEGDTETSLQVQNPNPSHQAQSQSQAQEKKLSVDVESSSIDLLEPGTNNIVSNSSTSSTKSEMSNETSTQKLSKSTDVFPSPSFGNTRHTNHTSFIAAMRRIDDPFGHAFKSDQSGYESRSTPDPFFVPEAYKSDGGIYGEYDAIGYNKDVIPPSSVIPPDGAAAEDGKEDQKDEEISPEDLISRVADEVLAREIFNTRSELGIKAEISAKALLEAKAGNPSLK